MPDILRTMIAPWRADLYLKTWERWFFFVVLWIASINVVLQTANFMVKHVV